MMVKKNIIKINQNDTLKQTNFSSLNLFFKNKLLTIFFLFFIISIANNVFGEEYKSVGYGHDHYRCIFNNTKIFIDIDKNGIEDYVLECNENTDSKFNIPPRTWGNNYSIKTNKPIIYYNLIYISFDDAGGTSKTISYYPYSSEFQKKKYGNEINYYENGAYDFFFEGKINVTCSNGSEIEINHNRNRINIACDFHYTGILDAMISNRKDMNSGNYFFIRNEANILFLGQTSIALDYNSNGIIDDYIPVNHNVLLIPANTTIFAYKKILLRKGIYQEFRFDRAYYTPFKYLNSTYYSDSYIVGNLEQENRFYKLEKRVSVPNYLFKKLDLDVTIFTKFKSFTEKSIEIIISNPTFERIDYEFYFSTSINTESINNSIKSLHTDEIEENNSKKFLNPFTYRKITIELNNNFDLLNLNYFIQYNERSYLKTN